MIYYIFHEGAHFIYAKMLSNFKQISFIELGIQIETYVERFTDFHLGIFGILGAVVTLIIGYCLVVFTTKIVKCKSAVIKAIFYYVTIGMLIMDPLYLSLLCGFFGDGDMNGIVLSFDISEILARSIFGIILIVNLILLLKYITPKYPESFKKQL